MQEGPPALKQPHFTAWSYEVRAESEKSPTAQTQGTSNMQTLGFPAGHGVTHRKVAGQELPVILPIMAH